MTPDQIFAPLMATLIPRVDQHNCIDYIEPREIDSVEPHGERFHDLWWKCSRCKSRFSNNDLTRLQLAALETRRQEPS